MSDCTLSGNIAFVYGGGGLDNSGTANLTDCTLQRQQRPLRRRRANYGTAYLTDCTISGNYADGGGGIDNPGGTTT